jgi:hypothetical protein
MILVVLLRAVSQTLQDIGCTLPFSLFLRFQEIFFPRRAAFRNTNCLARNTNYQADVKSFSDSLEWHATHAAYK